MFKHAVDCIHHSPATVRFQWWSYRIWQVGRQFVQYFFGSWVGFGFGLDVFLINLSVDLLFDLFPLIDFELTALDELR